MCRGFQQDERERLKIKAFYVHLSFSSSQKAALPDSLTLHFLPRINGGPLEINGMNVRPDTPGFITLHRAVFANTVTGGVVYGSREKVKASEGAQFEIYIGDAKVLKGIFRKDEEGENWKLDCKCGLESDDVKFLKDADVRVAMDGQSAVMTEKVDMAVARKRRRRKPGKCFLQGLEEIPEEREVEKEFESDGCCRCCEGDCEYGKESTEVEAEMDAVRWAVDIGIWAVCLGVGFLVSKASSKRLRQRRLS